ncbi:MAG: ABC transporter ATP-binding protein [Planctomycetes bacterium]|nr:ABC transporter ATP-binding protein [Planctomycetota bacterium]
MKSDNIAIKVEKINKYYRIGFKAEMHDSFAASMFSFMKKPFQNYKKYRSLYKFDDFDHDLSSDSDLKSAGILRALKDISMEIQQGEAVGIIGRNGSGKSTLLKILSRITSPTRGRAEIHGRISSLLEVGTGFHPELTGRENVYLNAIILGMRKKEVENKFDEIVDFSGVEKFIDTPVKRYSSGMKVRLAFSVAAHLEPEILVVDEVLAVGDAEFQNKCMGKMDGMANEGSTVLFVSHNMEAIMDLCSRVVCLEAGCVSMDGNPSDVVSKYLSSSEHGAPGYWVSDPVDERPGRLALLKHVRLISDNEGKGLAFVNYDEQVKIEIRYEIKSRVTDFKTFLLLFDSSGRIVLSSHDTDGIDSKVGKVREPGIYNSTCVFPDRLLRPGRYSISIGMNGRPYEDVGEEHQDVVTFSITPEGYTFNRKRKGIVTPHLAWEVKRQ